MRDIDLGAWMDQAKADPTFEEVDRKVAESGSRTWLEPDEKALLFAIGAYAPGDGRVVEIGAFEGGSASFLAAGVARRGIGRVHSIDPHLGAPPWFGLAPHKRTLSTFEHCLAHCGLSDRVRTHLGDSRSVAAVWPGSPLDAVLIDGDHSYLGALADFECWGSKVQPGGLILFDDVGGSLSELNTLVDELKELRSVEFLGSVGEVAVFRRGDADPWALLSELSVLLAGRRVHRPWDLSPLHATGLPANFRRDEAWPSIEVGEAYMVAFFARCGAGPYGYTQRTPARDRVFLEALCLDRGDGALLRLDGLNARLRATMGRPASGFRAIFCRPEEAPLLAPRLLDGGVLFVRDERPQIKGRVKEVRAGLLDAGLSGCGCTDGLHWGVWRPDRLSSSAVLHYALAAAVTTRAAG